MKSVGLFGLLLCLLLLLVGCEVPTEDSSAITTFGTQALIDVTADGSGETLVTVELRKGGERAFLDLAAEDSLQVLADGQEKGLERVQRNRALQYVARFTDDKREFLVSFWREKEDDAPASKVTMPNDFRLIEPVGGSVVDLDEPVLLRWGPAEPVGTVAVLVEGKCFASVPSQGAAEGEEEEEEDSFSFSGSLQPVRDSGAVEFRLEDMDGMEEGIPRPVEYCELTFSVVRERAGVLDPHFGHGGQVVARLVRSVTVEGRP